MRNIKRPRLCKNYFEAIIAISEQILIAKDETRARLRSDDAKLWKDRLNRGIKRRARQRLEINTKAVPGVLVAPLPNGIDSHSSAFIRK
jgi:hypothetical protein